MSQEQIAEFIKVTGATSETASRYLHKNDFDVKKAIRSYYGGRMPPSDDAKQNQTWYTGGSKSGVAVITPGNEGIPIAPVPISQPAQQTLYTGQAHSLASASPAESSKTLQPMGKPVKTNYATPGAKSTRVRIEMSDGGNLMLTVDLTATVGDLKQMIVENRPGADASLIKLRVAMPPQPLDDDSVTIEGARLQMASIKCQF